MDIFALCSVQEILPLFHLSKVWHIFSALKHFHPWCNFNPYIELFQYNHRNIVILQTPVKYFKVRFRGWLVRVGHEDSPWNTLSITKKLTWFSLLAFTKLMLGFLKKEGMRKSWKDTMFDFWVRPYSDIKKASRLIPWHDIWLSKLG